MSVANKPVASASYSGTPFTAILNDVDISVKAAPGNFKSFSCSSISASNRYAQIHNKTTAPANGDVPLMSFWIPPLGIRCEGSDFFGEGGLYLSTGISFGISTTAATFTAATTTDHITNGIYV
jgi:hypothetical protein